MAQLWCLEAGRLEWLETRELDAKGSVTCLSSFPTRPCHWQFGSQKNLTLDSRLIASLVSTKVSMSPYPEMQGTWPVVAVHRANVIGHAQKSTPPFRVEYAVFMIGVGCPGRVPMEISDLLFQSVLKVWFSVLNERKLLTDYTYMCAWKR